MRGENITDVYEWLDYHRWLGVDKVYLTENAPQAEMRAALQGYLDTGFVTYAHVRAPHAQISVFKRCIDHAAEHNWIAFIDADEYLIINESEASLAALLDTFKMFPGLSVHWVMVGPSSRETRPAEGGVLQHYAMCEGTASSGTKIIANTYYIEQATGHPHNIEFRGEAHPVNEQRFPLSHQYERHCAHKADASCPVHPGWAMPHNKASVRRIGLYHFVTRSREDFAAKISRAGGTNSQPKTWEFFERWARCAP